VNIEDLAEQAPLVMAGDWPDPVAAPPEDEDIDGPDRPISASEMFHLLSAVWNQASIAMWVRDEQGRVLLANPAAQREPMTSDLDLSKITWADAPKILIAQDAPPLTHRETPAQRALRGEKVQDEEYYVVPAGQTEGVWFRVSALPFRLADRRKAVLITWEDISERRRRELFTERTVQRLEQLLDGAAGYAILMLDRAGRVLTWSRSARRLLGYPAEEIIGQDYACFHTPQDRVSGRAEAVLERALTEGWVETDGVRVRRDGSRFWARSVINVVRGADGEPTGFVKVTHDVTDRRLQEQAIRRLNDELRRLNEQLEDRVRERTAELAEKADQLRAANVRLTSVNDELESFSYSVSHDLRAPLRAIQGFARILTEDYGVLLPADALGYVERVRASGQELGRLVDGLLELSRIQRQDVVPVPIDMTALVAQAWRTQVAQLAQLAEHRVPAFALGDLPMAEGDPRLLHQVWGRLLENAVKFSARSPDPRVEVFAEPDERGAVFGVRDNGCGFEMAQADKLFTVFQRLHRVRDYPGIGVGLALAARIVTRHGGLIWAEGEPDRGAVFRFTLGWRP
jgi:PAS domain S-box-containing protein